MIDSKTTSLPLDADSLLRLQEADSSLTQYLELAIRSGNFHGEIQQTIVVRDGEVSVVRVGIEKSIK